MKKFQKTKIKFQINFNDKILKAKVSDYHQPWFCLEFKDFVLKFI